MLDETVFRTENIPAPDRFEYWRDHMSRMYTPVEANSDQTKDFPASQRILNLNTVRLWITEHPPVTLHRTPKLIRESDPELYNLSMPLRGNMKVTGSNHSASYAPHDLALQETSRPHSMQAITSHTQERIFLEWGCSSPEHCSHCQKPELAN